MLNYPHPHAPLASTSDNVATGVAPPLDWITSLVSRSLRLTKCHRFLQQLRVSSGQAAALLFTEVYATFGMCLTCNFDASLSLVEPLVSISFPVRWECAAWAVHRHSLHR